MQYYSTFFRDNLALFASPDYHSKMANDHRGYKLAVLIDADNASPRIADRLFEEIAQMGEASVRRIYGDFSGSRLKSWADVLSTHAIKAHQSFAYTTGKNASDIALVIDAMDLLHTERFDGFCLVSSDSDFTGLASRIREQGIDVFGFGEQKTPESFRRACKRFVYTENLLPEASPGDADRNNDKASAGKMPPSAARPLLKTAIAQIDNEGGWVALGRVGHQLATLASDFDPRNYGQGKLSDLVDKAGEFETRKTETGHIQVRVKPSKK